MSNGRFGHTHYTIRRKVFKIFGAAFHVFDDANNVIFYSKQKAFKLKEDIRLFADETMSDEILTIQARKIIDFSAAYDVIDTATGEKLGAMRRKGWSSVLRDQWEMLDANDVPIARILEDSAFLALVRRFLTNLIPQRFKVIVDDKPLVEMSQNFNPFVHKLHVDFSLDPEGLIDRRLGLGRNAP